LRDLDLRAEKARRRAARIAAKARIARRDAEELGVLPQQTADKDL
jgi:hypothetical protein